MKLLVIAAMVCIAPAALISQEWQKTEKVDTFSNTSFTEFTLTGKFLTRPRDSQMEAPVIVMDCASGEHRYAGKWFYSGKLINAHISTGAVIDTVGEGAGVLYRRDDGKAIAESWSRSKDATALFPSAIELNHILYGHDLVHKEGTTPAIKKLVLMADEYAAARFVMEFDLPDASEVYNACGLTIHQK